MDPHAQHRLQRSIRAMAVDVAAAQKDKAEALDAWRLHEFEQQLQLEVSGRATSEIAQMTLDLDFDVAFTSATGQRNSLLDRPHVTFGFEQTLASVNGQPTDVAVMLAATVTTWKRQRHEFVGATVAISALAPATVDFHGVLHATFQGYGATTDEPDLEG